MRIVGVARAPASSASHCGGHQAENRSDSRKLHIITEIDTPQKLYWTKKIIIITVNDAGAVLAVVTAAPAPEAAGAGASFAGASFAGAGAALAGAGAGAGAGESPSESEESEASRMAGAPGGRVTSLWKPKTYDVRWCVRVCVCVCVCRFFNGFSQYTR